MTPTVRVSAVAVAVSAALAVTALPVGAAEPAARAARLSQIQVLSESVLGTMLGIDVSPDSRRRDYVVIIEKRTGNRWKVVRYERTIGKLDIRTIDLPKGEYRVKAPAQYGLTAGHSSPVWLSR